MLPAVFSGEVSKSDGGGVVAIASAATGGAMEIAMEFHGYWNLPCAVKIARELEPFNILWLEEMLPQDNLRAYERLARLVRQPLCLSERLMTRYQFRELLENGAAQFIMPDIVWCGGFTEARKIAALADTYYLPLCPHNCGGPVQHAASIHLAAHVPNLFILESDLHSHPFEFQTFPLDRDFPRQDYLIFGFEIDDLLRIQNITLIMDLDLACEL